MAAESEEIWTVSLALPRPLNQLFTYRVTREQADALTEGRWVVVPFGRTKSVGFVVGKPAVATASDLPANLPPGFDLKKLRSVLELGSPESGVAPEVFALCRWASDYYRAPLGEMLQAAVPAATLGLKTKRKPKTVTRDLDAPPTPINLTEEQNSALEVIDGVRRESGRDSRVVLLEGVTGSGKTEVYLMAARRALAEGRGVIILVPEIALTPQLHGRFERGLGERVALWHSALAAGKRHELAHALREGELRVVVGARSAVFAPVRDLGLLIVDEEHDVTYKQEDRVRYHARDLAVVRAKRGGATVVLGSATPSLESRARVAEGKYVRAALRTRYAIGGLPSLVTVPLAERVLVPGLQAPLAEETLQALRETLAAGEQAMVFLNRRGFAAFLLCEDCGEVAGCPQCSVSLTYHKSRRELRCHVCGHSERSPDACKKCRGDRLLPMGAGTESLEEELPRLLPEARTLRLDRDQISSAARLDSVLEEFRSGRSNLLLGTQMLVKGHDFPGVTLVVVVLADALFRWPDFRAPERAYQTLLQVSGRAGRGAKAGRVLIQTYQPEHPVLKVLRGEVSAEDFLNEEAAMRKALGYPPYGRLARLRWENDDPQEARRQAQAIVQTLSGDSELAAVQVLGPSEALLERVKGIYRWDVLLKATEIGPLLRAVGRAESFSELQGWGIKIDIDPQSAG